MKKIFQHWKQRVFKAVGIAVASVVIAGYGQQVFADAASDDVAFRNGLVMTKLGNYQEVISLWTPLAARGHVDAQFGLAMMYYLGEGVAKDIKKALSLLLNPVQQGLPQAQFVLGTLYAEGTVLIQDYTYAHMWFNMAASRGVWQAEGERIRMEGYMTKEDISKAQSAARKCAAKNYKNC